MVDRPSIAAMRRQMYVPEERPDYEAYISDPENERRAYESAIGLAMLGLGPASEVPAALKLARNLYGGYRGLSSAERALAMRPEGSGPMTAAEQLRLESSSPQLPAPASGMPQLPAMARRDMQTYRAPEESFNLPSMSGQGGLSSYEPPYFTALPPGPKFAGSQSAGESPSYGFSNFKTNPVGGSYKANGTSILPTAMSIVGGEGGMSSQPSAMSPEDLFDMRNNAPQQEERNVPLPPPRPRNLDAGRNVPLPPRRPSNLDAQRSPAVQRAASEPENMTLRDLWEVANSSGSASDFFRADKAMQEAMKNRQPEEARKSGGAVGGKDAAVHKALEIIHHLLTRG